eukprot:COSAG04_NODE_6_length_47123_cov_87.347482_34_plen_99_part_00
MPCNYSGYYDIASLKGFGYLQFDCARTARPQLSCSPHAGAACAGTAGTHPCRIPAAVRWAGSNRKDDWCQAKPMTCSESIANQSAMLHAADPDVKIGV